MWRTYVLFLACFGVFSWALQGAGGFGVMAAGVLSIGAATAYYAKLQKQGKITD